MKNRIHQQIIPLLLIFTTTLLTSCYSEYDYINTPQEVICSRFTSVCEQQVMMTDVAFRLNEYINTPDDKKQSVEDLYFPNNKLRKKDNLWEIRLSSIHVITDGGALNRMGSLWKVTDTLTTDTIELRYTAENIYSLITRNSRTIAGITNTDYRIETGDKRLGTPIHLYRVEGNCAISSVEKLTEEKHQIRVNAQTTQSLKFDSNLRINLGEVELSVFEVQQNNTDRIRLRYDFGDWQSVFY